MAFVKCQHACFLNRIREADEDVAGILHFMLTDLREEPISLRVIYFIHQIVGEA